MKEFEAPSVDWALKHLFQVFDATADMTVEIVMKIFKRKHDLSKILGQTEECSIK